MFAKVIHLLSPPWQRITTLFFTPRQAITEAIRENAEKLALIPVEALFRKTLELYEMIVVRHGLMIVGHSFGAKTSMYRILAGALTDLHAMGLMNEQKTRWATNSNFLSLFFSKSIALRAFPCQGLRYGLCIPCRCRVEERPSPNGVHPIFNECMYSSRVLKFDFFRCIRLWPSIHVRDSKDKMVKEPRPVEVEHKRSLFLFARSSYLMFHILRDKSSTSCQALLHRFQVRGG